MNKTIVVRGGGDLATGVIQKLYRGGFDVVVLECEKPTSIRRLVCLSECVYINNMVVEGMESILAKDIEEARKILANKKIPVIIDPTCRLISEINPIAVVDAIIAKKNLGTKIDMANIVIGLGPGFEAGKDVHCVIETNRGHDLGRLIFSGKAIANTALPGSIDGYTKERVIYSPNEGQLLVNSKICDIIKKGDILGSVNGENIIAKIDGVLRGILRDGFQVTKRMKIGDIDPRLDEVKNCSTISDKARCLGGAVLEAILFLGGKNE